mgnify:CR=1 FL=1
MAFAEDPSYGVAPAYDESTLGHSAQRGAHTNILDPGFDLTLRPMRYPQFFEMYKDAIKNTWTVEEIDFSDDLTDLDRKLMPAEKHLISRLVAFFATGEPTDQDKRDAICELANVTAGAIKTLLGGEGEWSIGIPDDKQEKIFESFNQGDQLKTRKFGGTGLGLSISKQIVELQGGVIWVESVEGEGSTFCFALPAMRAEGVAEEADAADVAAEIGPIRLLIAEDNPFNVIVTEDTLRAELPDVTIGKAENGKVAFEKVRDEEWDLVLMDIHMPEMSGLEATAAIRKLQDADKAKTLIVAMTASVLKEDTDYYLKKGMDGFVPKPFKVDQLISEIEKAHLSKKK